VSRSPSCPRPSAPGEKGHKKEKLSPPVLRSSKKGEREKGLFHLYRDKRPEEGVKERGRGEWSFGDGT